MKRWQPTPVRKLVPVGSRLFCFCRQTFRLVEKLIRATLPTWKRLFDDWMDSTDDYLREYLADTFPRYLGIVIGYAEVVPEPPKKKDQ